MDARRLALGNNRLRSLLRSALQASPNELVRPPEARGILVHALVFVSERLTLFFALISTSLYLGWAGATYFTSERHMTGALLFYAGANVFLVWPILKKFL